MISDRIDRFESYFKSTDSLRSISRFLKEVSPQMEDKEYEIDGQDIFARIMSYDTVGDGEGKLEGHRIYVDIQTTLAGVEVIDWIPREAVSSKTPYNEEKDVEFFVLTARPYSRIRNVPGIFSLFFPEDAHTPKLSDGGLSEHIKKAVIKVKADILRAVLR